MQWWCSAEGQAWTWEWRAYPGVWVFVALSALAYYRLASNAMRETAADGVETDRVRLGPAIGGIVLLWAGLDWPLGALGAGYLASVHMLQYLLLALAAPPLLLIGLPARAIHRDGTGRWPRRLAIALSRPVPAVVLFVVVTAVTHIPMVVDRVMPSQLGSFALDLSWLVAGLLFWWSVIGPTGPGGNHPAPVKLLYLFPVILTHTVIAVYMVFARFPIYATYELAPPIGIVTALGDQQLAGGLMWVGGAPIMWGVMAFVFYRWSRAEMEPLDEIAISPPPI